MPRTGRQLKADLRRAGFVPVRQAGSHVVWQHTRYPDITFTLAVGDGQDADHYEERGVRQAIARVRSRDTQEEP
jgi:predicted RNA binding protein YcfA (HicA-like mRNA interferase family)